MRRKRLRIGLKLLGVFETLPRRFILFCKHTLKIPFFKSTSHQLWPQKEPKAKSKKNKKNKNKKKSKNKKNITSLTTSCDKIEPSVAIKAAKQPNNFTKDTVEENESTSDDLPEFSDNVKDEATRQKLRLIGNAADDLIKDAVEKEKLKWSEKCKQYERTIQNHSLEISTKRANYNFAMKELSKYMQENDNLTSHMTEINSNLKLKDQKIAELKQDLERTKCKNKENEHSSQTLANIEKLIANNCPNLPRVPGKLFENIEQILNKMTSINNDKKTLYQEKKSLQKINKEFKKTIENFEIDLQHETEKSSTKIQKLKIDIEDMKYELQQEKSSQKQTNILFKSINGQLTKANEKNKILELQIMKHDSNESMILLDQKKEINDLKEKLEKSLKSSETMNKPMKETNYTVNQKTQITPAQVDAAISVNLTLTSNDQIAQEDKINVLNKMRDKVRSYAMKEGSLGKDYFNFTTVMAVNDILERSVADTIGEKIKGTVFGAANSCKTGKSFHNLTDAEKRFLRPDLI